MPIPLDSDGWLAPGQYGVASVIRHPQTQKTVSLYPELDGKPIGLVWHWSAGGYGAGTGNSLTNYMIAESYSDAKKASWHFFINKRGEIHQFAPVNVGTWTTGTPGTLWNSIAGVPVPKPVGNVNRATIGVELENAGVLLPSGGRWYAWPYGIGAEGLSETQAREAAAAGKVSFKPQYEVAASRAVQWSDGNAYDAWTPQQVFAAQELVRALRGPLGWTSPEQVDYGHRTFYSKRDPGLLWMDGALPGIQDAVWGFRAGGVASSTKTPLFVLALLGAGFIAWKYRRS